MSKTITVSIVGAGSSYTPELIAGIIAQPREQCPVSCVRLTDIHQDRLKIMAGLTKRMFRHAGLNVQVDSGTDLPSMLEGSDFVITQIRVGGMEARVLDETIPQKYGLLGQETTGVGGMFKALRTIPHMIKIANTVANVCPNAFILNYTNPSGIVTEAVTRHTKAKFVGLCSGIPGMIRHLREQTVERFPDIKAYCVGLNHLGFLYRFESQGKDVTGDTLKLVIEKAKAADPSPNQKNIIRTIETIDAIPIQYVQYFFNKGKKCEQQQNDDQTRAQVIMDIEKEVFAEAAKESTVEKPEALKRRGGKGYSNITFSFLSAILNNTQEELVCSVRNNGCIAGIDDDASVELVCRVGSDGAKPIPVGPIPLAVRGLIQTVKAYETLTVDAAVSRSRKLAVQALLNHPLAGDLDVVEPLVDEMLQAHDLTYS